MSALGRLETFTFSHSRCLPISSLASRHACSHSSIQARVHAVLGDCRSRSLADSFRALRPVPHQSSSGELVSLGPEHTAIRGEGDNENTAELLSPDREQPS